MCYLVRVHMIFMKLFCSNMIEGCLLGHKVRHQALYQKFSMTPCHLPLLARMSGTCTNIHDKCVHTQANLCL
jgi:hypothetical protein